MSTTDPTDNFSTNPYLSDVPGPAGLPLQDDQTANLAGSRRLPKPEPSEDEDSTIRRGKLVLPRHNPDATMPSGRGPGKKPTSSQPPAPEQPYLELKRRDGKPAKSAPSILTDTNVAENWDAVAGEWLNASWIGSLNEKSQ